MKRLSIYSGGLLLAAALVMPLAGSAIAGQDDHDKDRKRIYDKEHKDYHQWDENEGRAWNRWLTENHREAHEFAKANRRE